MFGGLILLTILTGAINAIPYQALEERAPASCKAADAAIAAGLVNLFHAQAFCTSFLTITTHTVTLVMTASETTTTIFQTSYATDTITPTSTVTVTAAPAIPYFGCKGKCKRAIQERAPTIPGFLKMFLSSVISQGCSCATVVTTPSTTFTMLVTGTSSVTSPTLVTTSTTISSTAFTSTTVTPVFESVYASFGCAYTGSSTLIGQDVFGLSTALTNCADYCLSTVGTSCQGIFLYLTNDLALDLYCQPITDVFNQANDVVCTDGNIIEAFGFTFSGYS